MVAPRRPLAVVVVCRINRRQAPIFSDVVDAQWVTAALDAARRESGSACLVCWADAVPSTMFSGLALGVVARAGRLFIESRYHEVDEIDHDFTSY